MLAIQCYSQFVFDMINLMDPRKLITEYLQKKHMMQLATLSGEQPWICTVYYIVDNQLNLYWLSLESRRHSKEIIAHSKVAVAIPVKFDNGEPVIGIQIEGSAQQLDSSLGLKQLAESYANKFGRTTQWVEDFCANKTEHKMYKFTPNLFVLFDEQNFPKNIRQEYKLN